MVVPSFKLQASGLKSLCTYMSSPSPQLRYGLDTGTVEQAAAISQTAVSNSLLVARRKRTACLLFSERICPHITDAGVREARAMGHDPFFSSSVLELWFSHVHV